MTEKLSDDRFLEYYHAVTHALACCDGVSREDCELVVSNVMRVTDREIADLERRLEAADDVLLNLRTWLKNGAKITATDINGTILDGPQNLGITVDFATPEAKRRIAELEATPARNIPSTE